MKLRPFHPDDAEALAAVCRDSVRALGPQGYTRQQVEVWALFPENLDEFRSRLVLGTTLVAEVGGAVVAFGQLEPSDHLALLYCSGAYARRGVGSAIYAALEGAAREAGVAAIRTEASRISKPFFEKHGYRVVSIEYPIRFGLEFERFCMAKSL